MLSAAWSARLDDGMEPGTEAAAMVVEMSVASQLAVDARAAVVDEEAEGAAEAQSPAVRMSSAGSALADAMDCWCAVAGTGGSALMLAVCVEGAASVGRSAELEPKLTVDVGASCAVSAPAMPASAGSVVGDGGADAEVELAAASSAIRALAVPDAAGAAKLPAEVADTRAVSSSSKAAVELA
jgi:hypothetical protein